MKRVTFHIGIGTRNGEPLSMKPVLEIDEAQRRIAETFGGFTSVEGNGGWFDPKTDKVVYEPSLAISVFTQDLSPVEAIAVWLRDLFAQSCVAVAVDNLEGFKYV